MKSSPRKAFIFALLAVLSWSTVPTAFKLGLEYYGLDPYPLLLIATLTSFLVLGIIVVFTGRMSSLGRLPIKEWMLSALLGLLNPVVYYLILLRAYELLPAQVAQPLNMVWPIVLVLISIPVFRIKVGWLSIAAMLLSFSGVVILSLQDGNLQGDSGNRTGIILALSSSVIWALYWIGNARSKRDPVTGLFLNFSFAVLYLCACLPFLEVSFPQSWEGWAAAGYVGVFEMGLAFVFWLLAMQHSKLPDKIGNLVYLAPFLNLFPAKWILQEDIYITTVIGILLLVSGIIIQNVSRRNAS